MTKFLHLLKFFWHQTFRAEKLRSDGKKNRAWVPLLIVGIYFLFILIGAAVLLYKLGEYCGTSAPQLAAPIITTLVTAGQLIILLFGISTILNTLFTNRDGTQLLPLPIKGSTIFLARLVLVYVQECFVSVAVTLFFLLPFGLGLNSSAVYFVSLLPTMILMPVLPLALGCLIAFPLSLLNNFLKNKGFWGILFYILLFGAIFVSFYVLIFNADELLQGDNIQQLLESLLLKFANIGNNLYPNVWVSNTLNATTAGGYFANAGLTVLCYALLMFAAVMLSKVAYTRALSRDEENNASKTSSKSGFKEENKLALLVKADFRYLFRDNKLGIYCLFGTIISPIMVGLYSYIFNMQSPTEGESMSTGIMSCAIYFILLLMSCSTNVMASTAVSRDRHIFYIYKYMPMDATLYAQSKVYSALAVNVVINFISVVIGLIFKSFTVGDAVIFFILLTLISYGNSCLQILFDMANPRLKWTNMQEGLKNNSSGKWSILLSFAVMVVFGLPVMLGYIFGDAIVWLKYVLVAATFVMSIVYALVSQNILHSKAQKLSNNIE